MQTLKTAAIVVLLMTVMYGAYVSMTAPPEPLPPEVSGMLVPSEEFNVDDGMVGSIGGPDVDDGSPKSPAAAAGDTSDGLAGEQAEAAKSGTQDRGVSRSITDSSHLDFAAAPTGSAASTPSSDALNGDHLASRSKGGLPTVSGDSSDVEVDRSREFPSTGDNFSLPSPGAASSTFEPSIGQKFSGAQSDSGDPASKESSAETGEAPKTGSEPSKGESSEQGRPNIGLANAIRTADKQYGADQPKEALATLSLFYDTPNLSASDRDQLLSRLDPLAREVIYSPDHLLEQPHRVRQNETLMEIASEYEVPWRLLANINSVDDPVTVLPGTDLKVVRGPFRADIDLTQQELTLFLGDLYAGRFPIQVGTDPAPEPGTYTVHDKQSEHTYYDHAGSAVPPDDPDNPYGSMWLDLGGQLCLHGSPSPSRPTDRGCISVADDHAADLHGILSQGSSVTIRR